ncbi:Ribosomal RNA small subunit methyltransferase F [Candidatus Bilamarchaeum dharawalense]|uniref:Ribosomal RNA small subunit methyltransferase F n=1 Tax=Candidatus Bilamarchaeum dharawalense TaxID=2885759 RepID=A0A5E4LKE0_9ARCH|nr:Ribosomal RNA small subunit methyltransferase F [Candidatus Bilamarchaeum dharawalense]
MTFIANKQKNFEKYLENQFGIRLPEGTELFYADGVRVGNREIQKSPIYGDRGYAACDDGFNPTNSMIQNFGHLATKNVIEIKDQRTAQGFAFGKGIRMDLGTKARYVILKYANQIIGLGYYDATEKKIKNKIPEKRRRNIVNNL